MDTRELTKEQRIDAQRGVDHISVTCVFFCHDGNGRILLHKRSAACRDEHDRWDCGGGSMEFGESFEETVRREVKEEYCAEVLENIHITTTSVVREHEGKKTHWVATIHAVKVNPDEVAIGEPEKMEEIGWFSPEELPEPLHSMFRTHFAYVKKYIV